jgi:O-antigen/teichoic acid export membrane protein
MQLTLTTSFRHKLANLTALAAIQISNAVLPLAIFPYTFAVLGADIYSKIVLSETLALFLVAIVLYSFEVDGVSEIAGLRPEHRNVEKISIIFSSIIYLRLMLFICSAPLVILIALFIDSQLLVLVACWLLVPLSYALQPNWLYQGLEWNAPVAILAVVSRVAAVAIIFTSLGSDSNSYFLVPLAIGSMYLLSSICTLVYAMRNLGIRLVKVPSSKLRAMLWSGKEVFMGNVSVILYRDANVLVLTLMGIPASGITAYSLAEKLVKAIQASIRPLNQLFFPEAIRLSQLARVPSRLIFGQLLRITLPQLAALAILLIALAATYRTVELRIPFAPSFENIEDIALLIGTMSAATFIGVSNFMFGSAGLNALGERRYFLMAILGTGLINIACSVLLVSFLNEFGAAISFVLAEALLLSFIVRKYFQ